MKTRWSKMLAVAMVLCLTAIEANATEQCPDYIVINKEQFELYVDWSFPSPLQVYYTRIGEPSPFQSWSTANYRGHIATWEIRDSSLYLTEIDTRPHRGRTGTYFPNSHKRLDTVAGPAYFGIKPMHAPASSPDGSVLADWFSGTITASRTINPDDERVYYSDNSTAKQKKKAKARIVKQKQQNKKFGDIYLYVRNGKVVAQYSITEKDTERAYNISEKDTADHAFMEKFEMLYLDQNYRQFCLSQGLAHDQLTVMGHRGVLAKKGDGPSSIMAYYDNDPLNWYFNWENFQFCGAPAPIMEIIHDSLFVTGMNVLYSKGLFDQESAELPMADLFPQEELTDGRLFASWMNGTQVVQFYSAPDTNEKDSQRDEYLEKILRLEVKEGVVLRSAFYPTSFAQDSANGPDRAKHFCHPDKVCCTGFEDWLPEDIKKLPTVTEDAAYLGEKEAMLDFLKEHPLADTTISGWFFIGFGLNCKGEADHFWITDIRNAKVIDWGQAILDAVGQLPQQWQPAKYSPTADGTPEPVDSYQVIDVTISNGQFVKAYLHR